LHSKVRDASASNEVNPSESEPKSKGIKSQLDFSPPKIINGANKSAAKTSVRGAEDNDESASGDNEAVGANEIPMKVSSYDAAAPPRRVACRGSVVAPSPAVPSPAVPEHPAAVQARPVPPAGYRVACGAEVEAGKALVGKGLLHYRPTIGWVRGCVHGISRSQQGYSHLVKYGQTSAIGHAVAASLLDSASHGPAGRWVLLLPNH
jgi:hypothetical protein